MWPLPLPNRSAQDVYRTCISRANEGNQWVLNQYSSAVQVAAQDFEIACRTQSLHLLDAFDFQPPIVAPGHSKELEKVYTDRMSKKQSAGREIYDELRAAAPNGRCPLCGVGSVRTLDHHLPKSKFPFLAVVPANLVPACSDCNHTKTDVAPTVYADQTLHPYFDDIDDKRWLRARVVEQVPVVVEFYVSPPTDWSSGLVTRVRRHFELLGLASLYADQAANELTEIESLLGALLPYGADGVRAHLQEQADHRGAARRNGWTAALYSALADSSWFCSGGFVG